MSKVFLKDSAATFTTDSDGLRGVPVLVMDRDDGTLQSARVYRNTADILHLDVALSREPDQYDAYILGSNPFAIESADLTFGAPRELKSLRYMTVEYERGSKGYVAVYLAADQTSTTRTNWQRAGNIPLNGPGYYRLPLNVPAATGRAIRYLLMSTIPGQSITITHISFEYEADMNFVQ